MRYFWFFCLSFLSGGSWANEVHIQYAQFHYAQGVWTVHLRVQHEDSGWEHYADAWRIVDEQGSVLGTRTLYHPHVDEQPFTRSLSGLQIPPDVQVVIVEAHDNVHGWSSDRLHVDLNRASGDRYQVLR
ncbi:MAG: hypothetical protein K0A95_06825 [Chromatiales bacterium]|nr:hypothetical protein [Gammaproteobacteria bacterium]MBW6476768.1 hypothetical protein [Chromatiales bacterium]